MSRWRLGRHDYAGYQGGGLEAEADGDQAEKDAVSDHWNAELAL